MNLQDKPPFLEFIWSELINNRAFYMVSLTEMVLPEQNLKIAHLSQGRGSWNKFLFTAYGPSLSLAESGKQLQAYKANPLM